jgi:hypothetical protein
MQSRSGIRADRQEPQTPAGPRCLPEKLPLNAPLCWHGGIDHADIRLTREDWFELYSAAEGCEVP